MVEETQTLDETQVQDEQEEETQEPEQQVEEAQNPMQVFEKMIGSEVRAALAEQEQARYHQAVKAQEEQKKALEKQAEEQAKKQKEQQKLEEEQALKAQEEQKKAWEEHQKAQQKNLEYTVRTQSKEALNDYMDERHQEQVEQEKQKRKEYEEYAKRHQPRMKFLNPNARYDNGDFYRSMDNFKDLNDYMEKIKKDPTNPDNLRDLGKLVANDESYFFGKPTDKVFEAADILASKEKDIICGVLKKGEGRDGGGKVEPGYVENNWDEFMDLLGRKELEQLVFQLPFFKTGEADLDRLVSLIGENKDIARMKEEGKGITEYISGKISEKPKWAQELFEKWSSGSNYLAHCFDSFVAYARTNLNNEMSVGKGKNRRINEGKIKTLICKSLDVALDALEDEIHLGAQGDIYDDCIGSVYSNIAWKVFPKVKGEYKWENDPEREERKEYRKKVLGMWR
jgi:chemotaxis protein histidine kinase CheA